MKLICVICKYEVAKVGDFTKLPLIGAMFESRDPFHGVPVPWSPVTPWEHMYCPMCNKRAFHEPVDGIITILTDEGEAEISEDGVVLKAALSAVITPAPETPPSGDSQVAADSVVSDVVPIDMSDTLPSGEVTPDITKEATDFAKTTVAAATTDIKASVVTEATKSAVAAVNTSTAKQVKKGK